MLDIATAAASTPPPELGDSLQWLTPLLLAMILVAVAIGTIVLRKAILEAGLRKPERPAIDQHITNLSALLESPDLDQKMDTVLLLEATLATKIDERMQRFESMEPEAFAEEWQRSVYKPTSPADMVKEWFSRPGPRRLAEKLFDKVLSVLNKTLGIG